MLNDRIVFLNGDFINWDQAKVHLMSHSFGRGSAIFEVLSVHKTDSGTSVFRLDEHINRLFRTAELLHMKLAIKQKDLTKGVLGTVKKNNIKQGIIKIVCFFPQISLSCDLPVSTLDVSIFAIDPSNDINDSPPFHDSSVSVCISKWRKLDPQTVPVEAKAAANYLNGILAQEDARQRGFEFALMLDTQGFIAEGATESIFLVKDNSLMTPTSGTILNSITTRSILELANLVGIKTLSARLHPDLLFEAEEIFLSNTPYKVIPVQKIEDYEFESPPGPVTKKISSLMEKITSGRDMRFKDWLFMA